MGEPAGVDPGVFEVELPIGSGRSSGKARQQRAGKAGNGPGDPSLHSLTPSGSSSTGRAPYTEPETNREAAAARFVQRPSKSAPSVPSLDDLVEEVHRREVAARIRELRERSPLSQQGVADELGIGLRAYQKLERVGTTKWERAQELAKIHQVDPEWIWHGENNVLPSDRLARIEAKLDELLARGEERDLEQDEEAEAQRSDASAKPSARRGRANGSQ